MPIRFEILEKDAIPSIIPLIQEFTEHKFSSEILTSRFEDMFTQNYECLGVFDQDKIIGICGLWYQTRHYVGKSCEPDHVYISPEYQGQKIGEQMFNFISQHSKAKGCNALELNTYVQNTASHKFYYNQRFEILGYHFLKKI